jgi:hypothetical protein
MSVPIAPRSDELKTETVAITWADGDDRLTFRSNLLSAINLCSETSPESKLKTLVASTPRVRNDRHSILPADPNTPWTGPDDLSMTSWIGYDQKNLYLAIDVVDDVHIAGDSGEGFWLTDCIQVAIDPAMDSAMGFDDNDVEFGFALAKTGPTARLTMPQGGPLTTESLRIERDEAKKLTRYRAAIPWSVLHIAPPAAGKVIALNIIASDDDGQGRSCWVGLTPGIAEEKRPEQYLHFVLERR